jgi:hypothetical protein
MRAMNLSAQNMARRQQTDPRAPPPHRSSTTRPSYGVASGTSPIDKALHLHLESLLLTQLAKGESEQPD